jgi:hypothetical protein
MAVIFATLQTLMSRFVNPFDNSANRRSRIPSSRQVVETVSGDELGSVRKEGVLQNLMLYLPVESVTRTQLRYLPAKVILRCLRSATVYK